MRITQLRQADLNLLVVFTVLAEERNASRAATRLFLSQPAVSRALQRLRDMFHDDLLVRTAAGYEPTQQGQRLIEELKVFLAENRGDPRAGEAAIRRGLLLIQAGKGEEATAAKMVEFRVMSTAR